MKITSRALLISTFVSLSAQAAPVWLSMSASVASQISASLPANAVILNSTTETTLLKVDQGDVAGISNTIHQSLNRCGGFMAHESKSDAVGSVKQSSLWKSQENIPHAGYEVKLMETLQPVMKQVSVARLEKDILKLSSFRTRSYDSSDARKATALIQKDWQTIAESRSDITTEVFKHTASPQPSIILTIKGSQFPDEVVILGAHSDSISADRLAPGADDNASGIAAITEVLRLMVNNNIKPLRTVKIIAYAAEEIGLVGSKEIAKSFKKNNVNVIGVLQLDMTLFKGSREQDILLVSDFTHKKQNEFLGKLIDEYVKVPWGYTKCGYGCSDHASWTELGYPASFPFESLFDDHNPHIHSSQDTLENAGGTAEHSVPFTRLALSFVIEMSS